MKVTGFGFVVLAAAAAGLPSGEAAPQAARQRPQATFEMDTTAVLLDVVVRDKKGRPVHDLAEADFEVHEDGVRQPIVSFLMVGRALHTTSADAPPPTAAPEADEMPRQTLIAMVFDRLSPNARKLAHKAALGYLDDARRPDDLVGVFAVDLGLNTLQAYTTEAGLIRRGLDRAAALGSAQAGEAAGQARSLEQMQDRLAVRAAQAEMASRSGVGGPAEGAAAQQAGAAVGAMAAQQLLNEISLNTLRTYEALERDERGYATTNGLMAVVNSLRAAPGRKTVIFFSEGMALPEAVQARFRSVIDTANRGNVSIYTMDAAGLRAESISAEAREELAAAAARRMRQAATGRDDGGILMKELERNEDRLHSDPHSGLGRLAEETGGFMIRDTNDLTSGMRRIDEDMRFHYMLAYSPTNQEYDGRFRTITVKVHRPGVEVQARKGYYAIRSPLPSPVLTYEAPALAALDRAPVPADFPVRARALSFPETKRPGLVPVLVEVPGNALTYLPDQTRKNYRADFTVLVRIRDADGRVVQKLSQHYPVTGPVAQLEAARRGDVLFYRETELQPGRYTVDAVAYDALTRSAGVRTTAVEVPLASDGKLRLSSIMLVRRAERVSEGDRRPEHPLSFGDVLLYPNLDEPISKAAQKELAFFLTAYAGNQSAPPVATIEILQDTRRLAQASARLPPADSAGRIQHVSSLSLDAFPPGTYELRVVLTDNQTLVARSVPFTVVN